MAGGTRGWPASGRRTRPCRSARAAQIDAPEGRPSTRPSDSPGREDASSSRCVMPRAAAPSDTRAIRMRAPPIRLAENARVSSTASTQPSALRIKAGVGLELRQAGRRSLPGRVLPTRGRQVGVPERHHLKREVERRGLDPPARAPDPLAPTRSRCACAPCAGRARLFILRGFELDTDASPRARTAVSIPPTARCAPSRQR